MQEYQIELAAIQRNMSNFSDNLKEMFSKLEDLSFELEEKMDDV
jgi:hypothetical protein